MVNKKLADLTTADLAAAFAGAAAGKFLAKLVVLLLLLLFCTLSYGVHLQRENADLRQQLDRQKRTAPVSSLQSHDQSRATTARPSSATQAADISR